MIIMLLFVFVFVTESLYAVLAILEVTMYIQGWP